MSDLIVKFFAKVPDSSELTTETLVLVCTSLLDNDSTVPASSRMRYRESDGLNLHLRVDGN